MPNQYGIVEKVACVCEHCGTITMRYPSQASRFCSVDCKRLAARTQIVRECAVCHAIFAIPPSQLHYRSAQYCSRECAAALRKTGEEASCEQCGKAFYASAWDVQQGKKYCSEACMRGARRRPIPRTCVNCEKAFSVTPYKQAKGEGKYCSKACAVAHKVGQFAINWRGGSERRDPRQYRYKIWRTSVLKRDGRACCHCGSTEELHAHHIKGWLKYPALRFEVANGVTLCAPCHRRVHYPLLP